jgi:L-fucono-1,5-lactonase
MAKVIDSHHHFWKYSPQEYGWIGEGQAVLKRDFLPATLKKEIDAAHVDGVVSVQARQTLEETRWLLELANQNDFIRGVVGWAPLISKDIEKDLEKIAGQKKLKAIRHVLQDEKDDRYAVRDDFQRGIGTLKKSGLVYDILIYEKQLPASIELVDKFPNQIFVLDHVAKPKIREKILSPWRERMKELAKRQNVYCKLSGMATEADHGGWEVADLKPYIDVVIDAFGPNRLMFGSDWPVCLLAVTYQKWTATVRDFVSKLSESEKNRVMGGTAVEAYKL